MPRRAVIALLTAVILSAPAAAQSPSGTQAPSAATTPGATAPRPAGVTRAEAAPRPPAPAPAPRPHTRGGRLMVFGGAALITGILVGGNAGGFIAVGGAVTGLYGLWLWLN